MAYEQAKDVLKNYNNEDDEDLDDSYIYKSKFE